MRPSLELTLAKDCVRLGRVLFLIDQYDRTPTRSPRCATTLVVNFQPFIDIGSVTDVEAVVGAAKDVNEKGIC